MDTPLPKLRAIHAFPLDVDAQPLVCLSDPLRYATQPVLLPYPAYFVVTQLDGVRTAADVQRAFARQFGSALGASDLQRLLATLDEHDLLESPRFVARRHAIDTAFLTAPVRPAAHAGTSYPDEAAALRARLDDFFAEVPAAPAGAPLWGLVAPHIDPRVGGRAYGHAYAAVAAAPAERYVVLGTSHAAGTTRFVATRKHFATPLGTVPTDAAFLDRLAARLGDDDLYRDEILHRTEHAIEFQVLLLQHVLGARPFTIVPLLVTSFHDLIAEGTPPAADARVAGFAAALRATIGDDGIPTTLVAGVDFAHVGAKFGDRDGLTTPLLALTEAKDRRLLTALAAGDGSGFFRELASDADRTRVCGAAPLLTLLEMLRGAGRDVVGRLLCYDTNRDDDARSAVTFASLAFGAR